MSRFGLANIQAGNGASTRLLCQKHLGRRQWCTCCLRNCKGVWPLVFGCVAFVHGPPCIPAAVVCHKPIAIPHVVACMQPRWTNDICARNQVWSIRGFMRGIRRSYHFDQQMKMWVFSDIKWMPRSLIVKLLFWSVIKWMSRSHIAKLLFWSVSNTDDELKLLRQ